MIVLRTDVKELKDQMKNVMAASTVADAVEAVFKLRDDTTPSWASQLTADVQKLKSDSEQHKEQLRVLQAAQAELERKIDELSKTGHPIYATEESAKLHTKHILRLSNFGALNKSEIESFIARRLDKLPQIPKPKVAVYENYTTMTWAKDEGAAHAHSFSNAFFEDKPHFDGKPIFCRPELPTIVLETQRPLNQTRHAYRQSLPDKAKNAKVWIDWHTRVLYDDTSIVAYQQLNGSPKVVQGAVTAMVEAALLASGVDRP